MGDAIPGSRRVGVAISFLLGATLLLWMPYVLFLLRRGHWMRGADRVLTHAPGIWVAWGVLLVCPLAIVVLGRRLTRTAERRRAGRGAICAGLVLLTAWGVMAGAAVVKARQHQTPLNPSVSRPIEAQTGLPVFPGAEGFGTRTPAGRGGKVIEVTTLADDGPGSLREALNDPQRRIVVFRIGGTIELASPLFINHPYVTVAGQTAPGGGICLKNCGLVITTNDVLVRHLRIRPGNEGGQEPDDNDAVTILGQHGKVSGAHNVVLDHISASWSEDEAVSTWFGPHDVTICWSIVSEALNRSRHRKGTHSAGLLVGGGSEHVTVHHCLLAHNSFRNPLVSRGGTHDFVNNVVYDWGDLPGEIFDEHSNTFVNFVGNYYRPGPSSRKAPYDITINSSGVPSIYAEGNLGSKRPRGDMDEWAIMTEKFSGAAAPEKYRARERYPTPEVTTWSADEAWDRVPSAAGATQPRRDAVDRRIVDEVRSGKGRIIDTPQEVGGHPNLERGDPPVDTDHDGMPDPWELEHELDPHNPADGNADRDDDGYTNVEEYLNSLGT